MYLDCVAPRARRPPLFCSFILGGLRTSRLWPNSSSDTQRFLSRPAKTRDYIPLYYRSPPPPLPPRRAPHFSVCYLCCCRAFRYILRTLVNERKILAGPLFPFPPLVSNSWTILGESRILLGRSKQENAFNNSEVGAGALTRVGKEFDPPGPPLSTSPLHPMVRGGWFLISLRIAGSALVLNRTRCLLSFFIREIRSSTFSLEIRESVQ